MNRVLNRTLARLCAYLLFFNLFNPTLLLAAPARQAMPIADAFPATDVIEQGGMAFGRGVMQGVAGADTNIAGEVAHKIGEGLPNGLFTALDQGFTEDGLGRRAVHSATQGTWEALGRGTREGWKKGGEMDQGLQAMVETQGDFLRGTSQNFADGMHIVGKEFTQGLLINSAIVVGAIGLSALAFFGIRAAVNYAEHKMMRPRLLIETSEGLFTKISNWWNGTGNIKMALSPEQEKYLGNVLKTTKTIQKKIRNKKTNVKFRNLLLWGPPGTGKTMFAKKLARESGMEFAMITGSSLSGFRHGEAIVEIDRLFKWAQNNKTGTVIFIDEVDSLLSNRTQMSSQSEEYKIVNHILNYTGERSNRFMLVMTTNHKDGLDSAIFDRIDDYFEMKLPDTDQRQEVLSLYIGEILFSTEHNGQPFVKHAKQLLTSQRIAQLARETAGLSNRNLQGIVNKMLTNADATDDGLLTEDIIQDAVREEITKKNVVASHQKGLAARHA